MSAPAQNFHQRAMRFYFGKLTQIGFGHAGIGKNDLEEIEAVAAPRNRYEPDDADQFKAIAHRTHDEESLTW